MNESIDNLIRRSIARFYTIVQNIQENGYIDKFGIIDTQLGFDTLKFISEFELLKKEFPETYPKFIEKYYKNYCSIWEMLEISGLPKNEANEYEYHFLNILSRCLREIIEHLAGQINPEPKIQEPPQKFEKLLPFEKILIFHYLNEKNKLFKYPLVSKSGKYFLSRLLDINPESIKNPVKNISDYTTNEVTKPQALKLYPTLEKVKSFFDESELNEISKGISIRIDKLKRKAEKD